MAVRSPRRDSSHARAMALVPGSSPGNAGVEVDDAAGKAGEKAHRQDAHPPGEDDEVGAGLLDDVGEAWS